MLLALSMLYPLLWLFFSSFKTQADIFRKGLKLLPEKWIFNNYPEGWKGFGDVSFATFFKNSIIISTLATIGAIISSAIVGFGFARNRFFGKKILFSIMISTMMIPYPILMIPQYLLFLKLRLINTFVPLIIIPWFGTPFFIFLVTQFMRSIPQELDESAVIDGCNKYTMFIKIFVPLSKAALFTVAIFSFYWRWNDFVQANIYLNSKELFTVTVALRNFADPTSVTNWGAMFAMSMLSLVPVFLVFFFLQKNITQGISTTGLKG
jgi:multiple sugar transport system permease protein